MNPIASFVRANKLAAGLAVAVLAAGATVGTFAAQDKLPGQSLGPSTQSAATPTARPTEKPEATDTPRAIKGIPTGNPEHPQATGTCEKGESTIKTVPSGVAVNVPCQAVEQGNNSNGAGAQGAAAATERSGNSDRTPGPGDRPDGTPTPASGSDTAATAEAGAGGGHGEATIPAVPTPHSR
jgi:hypothetical protein